MLAIIGVLAKSTQQQVILHPYSLSLNGTVYYHDNSPIQPGEFLYFDQYSNSKPSYIIENNSTDDVNGDGNYDNWAISSIGQLSYTTRIYYTQSIVIGGVTYFYNGALAQGTILYANEYSGSNYVTNLGPLGGTDIDGDGKSDLISTDSSGALSWSTQIMYPNTIILNGETYYYSGNLTSYVTIIYNGQYSDASPFSSAYGSGTEDIDGDGRIDDWSTDIFGLITFTPTIYRNLYVQLGGVNYYYDYQGSSLHSPVTVWSNPYSNATLVSAASGIDDVDLNGELDEWVISSNSELSWSTQITHPYQTTLFANTLYNMSSLQNVTIYLDQDLPLTQGSVLYNGSTSSAGVYVNSTGNQDDIDGDGNLDDWSTDYNGVLSFSMRIMYENSLLSYYYTGSLTSGLTILYTGQGSGSSVAANIIDSSWYTDGTGTYFEI